MSEDDLVRLAGPFGHYQCGFYHEIAMEALASGNREKAKKYFNDAANTGQIGNWAYHSARIFQRRLADPEDKTWPSWIDQQDGPRVPPMTIQGSGPR